MCLPLLTRDGNPGNGCQGAAFFPLCPPTPMARTASLSLFPLVSHDGDHHLPGWPATPITAAHRRRRLSCTFRTQMGGKVATFPPSCVDDMRLSVLPKRLQLKIEAVFGFRNLARLDLVVMERSPIDLTSCLFVWFSAHLTSAALGRVVRVRVHDILIHAQAFLLHVRTGSFFKRANKIVHLGFSALSVREHVDAFFQICLFCWYRLKAFPPECSCLSDKRAQVDNCFNLTGQKS